MSYVSLSLRCIKKEESQSNNTFREQNHMKSDHMRSIKLNSSWSFKNFGSSTRNGENVPCIEKQICSVPKLHFPVEDTWSICGYENLNKERKLQQYKKGCRNSSKQGNRNDSSQSSIHHNSQSSAKLRQPSWLQQRW